MPYRGTGPAVNDLLGGQINMLFSPPQVVTQHIAVGKLRMIGTTGAERSALFPDFPTIAATGLPNYASLGWFGLFAPAKTPAAIVGKISADTAKVLALDDAKKRLIEAGAEPAPNAPDVFTKFVNQDIAKWLDLGEAGEHQAEPVALLAVILRRARAASNGDDVGSFALAHLSRPAPGPVRRNTTPGSCRYTAVSCTRSATGVRSST